MEAPPTCQTTTSQVVSVSEIIDDSPIALVHTFVPSISSTDGEGEFRITWWGVSKTATLVTPAPGASVAPWDHTGSWGGDEIRCDQDTSNRFRNKPGCVFEGRESPLISDFYRLDIWNDDIDEMSIHVLSAITWNDVPEVPIVPTPNPSLTIPGGSPSAPLLRDGTTSDQARRTMYKACKEQWPDRTGKQCDEFPFASTAENAANPLYNYSVFAISTSDNQIGGRYLAGWYQSQRILPRNDRFYVYVNWCNSCACAVC